MLQVHFQADAVSHEQLLAVDSKKSFSIVLYSPESEKLSLELYEPDGTRVSNAAMDAHREDGEWPIGSTGQMVSAPSWRFSKPIRGFWRAIVTRKDKTPLRTSTVAAPVGHPDAYMLLWNDSDEKIFAHLGTYR